MNVSEGGAMAELIEGDAPAEGGLAGAVGLLVPPLVLLAVASAVFFIPLLTGARNVPGGLGDARFNIYILEHVYRWLVGLDRSLLSLPIFYPYPYTFAFSDMHAGSAIVYVIARAIGLDQYDAFKVWFVIGYVLTFAAAYRVMLLLRLSPWLAALAAFGFAFSLPAVAQMGHAQLTYRVGIPFAFYHSMRYAQTKRPADLHGLIGWISLQILINVYLGLFGLILSGITFLVALAVRGPLSLKGLHALPGAFARPFLDRANHRHLHIAVVGILTLAAVAMLAFYGYVGALYGFERPWPVILSMVPRPWSYFIMDLLPYWSSLSRGLPAVPMRNEHQIFMGVPGAFLFLAAAYQAVRHPSRASEEQKIFAFTDLAAAVLITTVGGLTLYWLVGHLPGFNALRAVARYQLVAAFPIIAAGFLWLDGADMPIEKRRFLIGIVALWMVSDLALMRKFEFSSQTSEARIEKVIAQARPLLRAANPVLAYGGDPTIPPVVSQIDAMLAAQRLGIPTLNGYSGNSVPGHELKPSCATFLAQLSAYDSWAAERGFARLASLNFRALPAGLVDCDLSANRALDAHFTDGPPPDADEARQIAITGASVKRSGNWLNVSVTLHNGSPVIIHSLAKDRLRLSWRLAGSGDSARRDWSPRVEIGADLAPGAMRIVGFRIPAGYANPGDTLQITFVVDGKFWAHNLGLLPIDLKVP